MINEKALAESVAQAAELQRALDAAAKVLAAWFDEAARREAYVKELVRSYVAMERSAEEMRRQLMIVANISASRAAR